MEFDTRLAEALEAAGFVWKLGVWRRESDGAAFGTTLDADLLLQARKRAHEVLDHAILRVIEDGSPRCRVRLTPQTEEGGAVVKITR
jgi:hypothetical protein